MAHEAISRHCGLGQAQARGRDWEQVCYNQGKVGASLGSGQRPGAKPGHGPAHPTCTTLKLALVKLLQNFCIGKLLLALSRLGRGIEVLWCRKCLVMFTVVILFILLGKTFFGRKPPETNMIKVYILLISQARRDNVLWNLVWGYSRRLELRWDRAENRAGGDWANKDHLLARLRWGVLGETALSVSGDDDHVSCYIMCSPPCVPCATQSRVCLNYLTGWQRARSYDMDQAQTRISPRVPIHWTRGRNNTKLCAWMILYKFWGSRSCENRGWRDERDMLWPLLPGAGGAQCQAPGTRDTALEKSPSAIETIKDAGQLILETRHSGASEGRHMTPASSHQLCPLHFIVPGSVSIISCPVSHLTHDSDPGPGGHWRNYSWIPHNESQANYGSNLVGASIKVLHHSLSFIKCLGGAG